MSHRADFTVLEFLIVVAMVIIIAAIAAPQLAKHHADTKNSVPIEAFSARHNLTFSTAKGVYGWMVSFDCWEPPQSYYGHGESYLEALGEAEAQAEEAPVICKEKTLEVKP